MLISHKHSFIALKTVKTASTSSEMFFQPACLPVGMEVGEHTQAIITNEGVVGRRGPPPKDRSSETWTNHMSAQKIHAQVKPEIWSDYLKIANVRNPFSRILSGFFFFFTQRKLPLPDGFAATVDRFDAFVHADRHSFMDMLFIDDRFVVDAPIFFETLADDIQDVAKRIGFERNINELGHVKKAQNKPDGPQVSDYFNTSRTDRIRRLDARAFEYLGYSENPADAHLRPNTRSDVAQIKSAPHHIKPEPIVCSSSPTSAAARPRKDAI